MGGEQLTRAFIAKIATSLLGQLSPEGIKGKTAMAVFTGVVEGFKENSVKAGIAATAGELISGGIGKALGFAPSLSESEIAEKLQEIGADKLAEKIGELGQDKLGEILRSEADEHIILAKTGMFGVPHPEFHGWANDVECNDKAKCMYTVTLSWTARGNTTDVNDGITGVGAPMSVVYTWALDAKTEKLVEGPTKSTPAPAGGGESP